MRAWYILPTVCFLIAVIGVGPFVEAVKRDPRSFRTYAIVAFDAGSAVIVSVADDAARVELVDTWGRPRWTRFVHGDVPFHNALIVAENVIAVSYIRDRELRVVAFDAIGRKLWDTRVAEAGAPENHEYLEGEIVGSTLIVWTPYKRSIAGLDLMTGTQLWKRERPGQLMSRRFKTSTALIIDNFTVAFSVDARTGVVQSSERAGSGCVLENDYMTLREHTLTIYEHGDLSKSHASYVRGDWGEKGWALLHACGTYESKPVVFLRVGDNNTGGQRDEIAIIEGGDVVRSLHLPQYSIRDDVTDIAGELPRFIPFLTHVDDKDQWLVMDLQTARVSSRGPLHDEIVIADMIRHGHRWYVASSYPDHAVTAIDGDSGSAYSAVTITGLTDTIEDTTAAHMHSNKLWVVSRDRAVSVIDLFTLAAMHVDRMAIERVPTNRWE